MLLVAMTSQHKWTVVSVVLGTCHPYIPLHLGKKNFNLFMNA